MRSRRFFTSMIIVTAAAVGFAGCGDVNEPEPTHDSAQTNEAAHDHTAEPTDNAAEPRDDDMTIPEPMQAFEDDGNVAEITIEGDDLMRFDVEEFTVNAGQMVRITLEHVGSLPAQAMGHNVVILHQGEDVFSFGADVGQEGGGVHDEYVPDTLRDRVIAFTSMIGGGETTAVEFRAPDEPGDYPYLCSFPGHFGQMNGIMTVE